MPNHAAEYYESQLHLANHKVGMRRANLRECFDFIKGMTHGFVLVELLLLAVAAAGLFAHALAEELRFRAGRRIARLGPNAGDRFATWVMKASVVFVAGYLLYTVLLAWNSGAIERAVR